MDEGVLGLLEDAHELFLAETAQLHPDREAPLQLRDQVAGLGDVEGTGGDEEDMIGANETVLRLDVRSLHHGQEVPLHALAAHVRPNAALGSGDLVDLVQEDDARVLGSVEGLVHDLVHVHETVQLVLQEDPPGLGHRDSPALPLLWKHILEHLGEVVIHPLRSTHGDHHSVDGGRLDHFDLDLPVLQDAVAQELSELLPGSRASASGIVPLVWRRGLLHFLVPFPTHLPNAAGTRHEDVGRPVPARGSRLPLGVIGCDGEEHVQELLFHPPLRLLLHLLLHGGPHHVDRGIHQVPHHGFHVPTHITHLREFGGLHLHEGGSRQTRQATRYLRFADTGRPDEDEIVREDLIPEHLVHLTPTPPVPESDRHGLLGVVLADDVLVELRHDLPGRQIIQPPTGFGSQILRGRGARYLCGIGHFSRQSISNTEISRLE